VVTSQSLNLNDVKGDLRFVRLCTGWNDETTISAVDKNDIGVESIDELIDLWSVSKFVSDLNSISRLLGIDEIKDLMSVITSHQDISAV
jgi:hypothetical protein